MKYIFVSFLVLCSLFSFSQNETKKWFFGNGAGLNFSNNPPTVITGGAISTTVGCASIADANGNLLFYTDGVTVYNQTHTTMANGTGLLGNNASQSAMIIKKPASNNLYYIFTVQGNNGVAGFNYSIVDMSLAAGNGSVTIKNATLLAGACADRLTATKHCNGSDYWLLIFSGGFKSYSLTSSGISALAVISTPTLVYNALNGTGCIKLSPNGRKLMAASSHTITPPTSGSYFNVVTLFDFDNSTGIISNSQNILNWNSNLIGYKATYGCEFSPDGTKGYFNDYLGTLWQHNLCAPTVSAGLSFITNTDGPDLALALKHSFQLAPNGKIYLSVPSNSSLVSFVGSSTLAVINSPNALGNACNYNQVGQSLGSYTCGYGLPNFSGSFFEQRPASGFTYSANLMACNTISFNPVSICSASGYSVIGYQWLFGDPGSGLANSSFLANPSHSYPSTGNYSVQLVRSFSCFSDTVVQTIHITSPTVSVSSPSLGCGVHTASANTNGGIGPYSYTWSPSSQTTAIATITASAIYTVTMADIGGGCAATATATISNAIVNGTVLTADALCNAANNGSASVYMTGGSGVYSYTWSSTIQNTSTVTNLSAGVHSVSIFDQTNQCLITTTFNINQPSALNVSVMPLVSYSACVGSSVSLFSNATGGSAPYQSLWTSGPATTSYNVSESIAGSYVYSITATDTHSCVAINTVAIQFVASPILIVSNVSVCAGSTAIFNVLGANSYTWYPSNINGNTYSVHPTSSTIYTVSGDNAGCIATRTVSVFIYSPPALTITCNSPICEGQTLLFNGNNASTYLWTGPQGYLSTQQNPTINNASPSNNGNYTYSVTDNNGCSSFANFLVVVYPYPTISVTGNFNICSGQSTTLIASGANSYSWSIGNNFPSITVSPTISTIYTVSVTDNNSCKGFTTVPIIVNPTPIVTLSGSTLICSGQNAIIIANGATSYSWNTGISSSTLIVSPINNTSYTVSGFFSNTAGCSDTKTLTIKVSNCLGVNNIASNGNSIKIYPNPSSGILFIDSDTKNQIKIYNGLGQIILEKSIIDGLNSFNLSEYDSGMYTLSWTNVTGISVYKFILSK